MKRTKPVQTQGDSSRNLSALLDGVSVSVFSVDDAGSITSVLGPKDSDLSGLSAFELFGPDSELSSLLHRAIGGEQCSSTLKIAGRTMDAQLRPIPAFPAGTSARKTMGALVTLVDSPARESPTPGVDDSEPSLKMVLDAAFDAVCIHDNGTIIDVNHSCERMFGHTREKMTGASVLDFVAPESREGVSRNIQVRTEQPYEAIGRRADGSQFSLEIMAKPQVYRGRNVRIAALRDISARKVADSEREKVALELRRQRAEYQVIFDSVKAMIWYKDTENRILRINQAAADAMGMKVTEIGGRSTYEMYPQEAQKYHEDDLRVISSGRPRMGIIETMTIATGEQRWVQTDKFPYLDENGRIIGVIVFSIDITERRRAEEALRESEERLRAIFNSARDVIFLVDREHRYLAINDCARQYGVEPATIIGKSIFDVQSKDIADFHARLHNQVFENGNPVHIETKFESNGERWHSLTLSPVRDGKGAIVAVTGISRDITDIRNAELERIALERKLMETQKLESMGVLAGGIAHDFNNLLAAILGNVSLAAMQVPPDSLLRTNLASIETTTHRAAELCKQMLAYAGKGRLDVQRVDLNAIISEMTDLLKISIGRTIILKLNLSANLPTVTADATQLRQVVMNLILNASEAIGPKEGAIGLSTSIVHLQRRDLIEAWSAPDLQPGTYVSIDVSDTGCGMDDKTKARIFDPFFSTKFTGRGLGLAAVMGIVRGHKGAIRVDSVPEKGTTFSILLPVGEKTAAKS